MKEKTLRFPGHADYIKVLKESGFFSLDPIKVGDSQIQPLLFTSQILFNEWKLGEEEKEFTVMTVNITGKDRSNNHSEIVYTIYDEYSESTKTSSMARTTGYTACAAVHLLMDGMYVSKGISPPEELGRDEKCFHFIIDYLKKQHIQIRTSGVK